MRLRASWWLKGWGDNYNIPGQTMNGRGKPNICIKTKVVHTLRTKHRLILTKNCSSLQRTTSIGNSLDEENSNPNHRREAFDRKISGS